MASPDKVYPIQHTLEPTSVGPGPPTKPDKTALDALRIDRASSPRGGLPMGAALAVLLVAGAVGGSIWWFNRTRPLAVRTVVVQEAVVGAEKTLLNASGYVTARREATVSSKVTGKVMEVSVEEGMRVEAGQVLARIDSSNVERSLRLAEAQLESARQALGETKANLVQAEREFRRIARLVTDMAANQVELDRAETEVKSLRARLDRQTADVTVSEREVAVWQQQMEDTIIRAPFAGIVTAKNAQPGEMISPMSVGGFTRTGICTIVDMSSLEIEVDVSESYINRVETGQPVLATLDSYPQWRIPAKVIAIIPTADRQKATVKVRVGFDRLDPRILPDMSVKVAFQSAGEAAATRPAATRGSAPRAVTIPKSAVRREGGRDVVWLVRNGRAERRAVTLGAEQGEQVAVVAGLEGGDRVVVEVNGNLTQGAAVTESAR